MSKIVSRPLSAAALSAAATPFRPDAYREALVAAAALLAHADGEVAPAERGRLMGMMRDEPAFAQVPADAVVEALAMHEANYRLDPEVAIEMAYEKLDAIRGQPRLCSAVVALCRALIPADGVAHPSEYRMLADIRARLGLTASPVHFGAYGVGSHLAPAKTPAA